MKGVKGERPDSLVFRVSHLGFQTVQSRTVLTGHFHPGILAAPGTLSVATLGLRHTVPLPMRGQTVATTRGGGASPSSEPRPRLTVADTLRSGAVFIPILEEPSETQRREGTCSRTNIPHLRCLEFEPKSRKGKKMWTDSYFA